MTQMSSVRLVIAFNVVCNAVQIGSSSEMERWRYSVQLGGAICDSIQLWGPICYMLYTCLGTEGEAQIGVGDTFARNSNIQRTPVQNGHTAPNYLYHWGGLGLIPGF